MNRVIIAMAVCMLAGVVRADYDSDLASALGLFNDGAAQLQARDAFEKMLLDYPAASASDRAILQRYVAHTFRNNGEYAQALPQFTDVLTYVTARPQILASTTKVIAWCHVAINGNYGAAITALETGLTHTNADPNTLMDLQIWVGRYRMNQKNFGAAKTAFIDAANDFPAADPSRICSARVLVGEADFAQGNFADAQTSFQRAIDDNPDAGNSSKAEAQKWIGKALLKQDKNPDNAFLSIKNYGDTPALRAGVDELPSLFSDPDNYLKYLKGVLTVVPPDSDDPDAEVNQWLGRVRSHRNVVR
jgi:tetratricopeptide (TPR) repeat protein